MVPWFCDNILHNHLTTTNKVSRLRAKVERLRHDDFDTTCYGGFNTTCFDDFDTTALVTKTKHGSRNTAERSLFLTWLRETKLLYTTTHDLDSPQKNATSTTCATSTTYYNSVNIKCWKASARGQTNVLESIMLVSMAGNGRTQK